MKRSLIKISIAGLAWLAVIFPILMRVKNLTWVIDQSFLFNLFPIFGLAAFSILWLHVISGVFEDWLRQYFDFVTYVRRTSAIVFILIILHPLFLLIGMDFNIAGVFSYGKKYIWLAISGWLLLITYDIGKALKKYNFFVKNWKAILLISTIGFLITFFHSLGLGSDLQSGPLRILWIFYGTTAIISTIYTYGIKNFIKYRS